MGVRNSLSLLRTGIELFGIIDGFKFWFILNIIHPIQMFIWLNTNKPYCTFCGFHCREWCGHPKLYKKEDILEHWKKFDKEMEKVVVGKDGMCTYCGEFKGIETIPDPNTGIGSWKVCVTCKRIIEAQQKLTFGYSMLNRAKTELEKEYFEQVIKESEDEIKFLSEESFTPTFSMVIKRKDE